MELILELEIRFYYYSAVVCGLWTVDKINHEA